MHSASPQDTVCQVCEPTNQAIRAAAHNRAKLAKRQRPACHSAQEAGQETQDAAVAVEIDRVAHQVQAFQALAVAFNAHDPPGLHQLPGDMNISIELDHRGFYVNDPLLLICLDVNKFFRAQVH